MNYFDTLLYRSLRYGLLAAVFVPLVIFRNSFSPFNFGKVIVFRILIEILLIAYIFLAIRYKEFRPNFKFSRFAKQIEDPRFREAKSGQLPNSIFWALTFFTVSYAISTFLGADWHQSFWGYWERMGGLFTWLHYYAFLVILVAVFKTKEDWLTILWLSVIAAVVSTFYGFFQKFSVDVVLGASGRLRIFGTLGNPAAFAGYLLFNFYFALYLLKQYRNKKVRIFLIGAIILFFVAIFMTVVRGAVLGLIISLLVFVILDRKHLLEMAKKKITLNLKFRTLIIGVLLFLILLMGLFRPDGFKRLTNFSLNQPTVQQRVIVWKIAWQGIKERPFFGWGPENFSSAFSVHYNPEISKISEEIFDKAHDILLDIGVTQGFVGLFIWLFLMTCLWRVFVKSKNYLFCSLIVAYLIHNFFFFDLFSSYLMFFILLGFGIYRPAPDIASAFWQPAPKTFFHTSILKIGFLTIMILSGALIFYANLKPALANFYSTRGYSLLYKNEGDQGLNYFSKAINSAFWSKYDVYRKFSESYVDFIYSKPKFLKDDDKEFRKKMLIDMISWFEKRNQAENLDYTESLYLHKTYMAYALFVDSSPENKLKTATILEEGIKKLPNALPLYYNLFDLLLEQGEFQKAEDLIIKAHELDQELNRTKFNMGLALILVNTKPGLRDGREIENGLNLIFESMDSGYLSFDKLNSLSKVLEKNKMYPEMLKLYLKLSEKDSRYLVHISYVYLLSSDRKNATIFADRALALNYSQIGNQGFRILSEVYKVLGDNKKRSEALLKSAP